MLCASAHKCKHKVLKRDSNMLQSQLMAIKTMIKRRLMFNDPRLQSLSPLYALQRLLVAVQHNPTSQVETSV